MELRLLVFCIYISNIFFFMFIQLYVYFQKIATTNESIILRFISFIFCDSLRYLRSSLDPCVTNILLVRYITYKRNNLFSYCVKVRVGIFTVINLFNIFHYKVHTPPSPLSMLERSFFRPFYIIFRNSSISLSGLIKYIL